MRNSSGILRVHQWSEVGYLNNSGGRSRFHPGVEAKILSDKDCHIRKLDARKPGKRDENGILAWRNIANRVVSISAAACLRNTVSRFVRQRHRGGRKYC